LATSGLVLANGSATVTLAANATSFQLPAVAEGSSYTVTVATQPAGLACAVADGTGTALAAVTDVAVTCTDQNFNISGTITGLTTGGLILANGSDTLTVMPGATSFTLPTPVAVGSSYAVIVQTQPTGLTCTVSGGSGTMPANNVVSVTVVCGVTTYTVGGSISGLTTTGLVLANGSDTLAVMAGSIQFTMPSGLPAGASFAVTVQTQPSGDICSVSNGSGAIATGSSAANVTPVQVICGPSTVMSFSTSGPASFTVPFGVTSLQVVATGGGGSGSTGGGMASFSVGNNGGIGGGPGGNGSITITYLTPPPPPPP
jgi:hypothetical protein